MTRILFWNINQSTNEDLISELCQEKNIDLLVLAENRHQDTVLLPALFNASKRAFKNIGELTNRCSFYSALPNSSVVKIRDVNWLTIKHVTPPSGKSFLFVAIHFASKMHKDSSSQAMRTTRIREYIDQAELEAGHSRTLVIGDFNQNPYELGMTDADGLHAVKTKNIANKEHHIVDGLTRKYFYNPMWNLMGDESNGPPGTYFLQSCEKHVYWHSFDQVLLRPSILEKYKEGDVSIIEKIGDRLLLKKHKIDTEISDHLPITVKIRN